MSPDAVAGRRGTGARGRCPCAPTPSVRCLELRDGVLRSAAADGSMLCPPRPEPAMARSPKAPSICTGEVRGERADSQEAPSCLTPPCLSCCAALPEPAADTCSTSCTVTRRRPADVDDWRPAERSASPLRVPARWCGCVVVLEGVSAVFPSGLAAAGLRQPLLVWLRALAAGAREPPRAVAERPRVDA